MTARAIPLLFAITAFLSSFLLFLIEPLQGKMLLPLFGGAPMVWNTCMVFFQSILLAGYLTAHITTKLAPRWQVIVQLALLAVPVATLPITLPDITVRTEWLALEPLRWLLVALAGTSGLVFFVVATASPLLQSWYSRFGTQSARDNPYVLYAAGNAGSLLALLAYPTVIEPRLRLMEQSWLWTGAYAGLVCLFAALGALVWRTARSTAATLATKAQPDAPLAVDADEVQAGSDRYPDADSYEAWTMPLRRAPPYSGKPTWRERCLWTALAFVPSSAMLGVTTYMTTDVAAIPMLWVLPLALYILSFALVFWRYPERLDRILGRLLPLLVFAMLLSVFADYRQNLAVSIGIHLCGFFVAAMVCHGRLAARRPPPQHLTEYYLWLSLGGVLGGLFNTLLAPQMFTTIAEYPLVLAAALALAAALREDRRRDLRNAIFMVAAFAGAALITAEMMTLYRDSRLDTFLEGVAPLWNMDTKRVTLLFGVPLMAATLLWFRPLCQAAAVLGFVFLAATQDHDDTAIFRSRSFFGMLTVREYQAPPSRSLAHGGIMHGEQRIADADARAVPRSYYHPDGPLGQLMQVLTEHRSHPKIGAIGLGTGAMAAYGTPDNEITFYELNPEVERLARDPKLFTYVDDCLKRWCHLEIIIGDGRLKLLESGETYDLIVVDAFSSDAIPVHLITQEALEAYLAHLNPGGMIAFHISNRYVNLEPVLHNLATAKGLGYAVRSDDADDEIGKSDATWAVFAAAYGLFEHVTSDKRWRGLEENRKVGVWADDYANVLRTMTWY